MSDYELEGWGWATVRVMVLIPFLFFGFFVCGMIEVINRIKYRKEWPK